MNSPYLIVKKLIIRGITKNYSFEFEEGLNIIWGDMDSGKSSILNLIDYCLGGSNKNLTYSEIISKGRTAYLEVDLNGEIFTLERNILDIKAAVKAYSSPYSKIEHNFPKILSVNAQQKMPDGWLSDFILESLGIPTVKIRESSNRENADSDRLSFRDLMKLMYLSQTKVGADSLLDFTNPAVFHKNVQVQKFVFNIHDERLTELQETLATELGLLDRLDSSQRSILNFLKEVNIDIDKFEQNFSKIESQELQIREIEDYVDELKQNFQFSTDIGKALAEEITNLKTDQKNLNNTLKEIDVKFDNYLKLKNTYQEDLNHLSVSKLTRDALSNRHDHGLTIDCPLCASPVSVTSELLTEQDIDAEIKSIKNRISGIEVALSSLEQERVSLQQQKNQIDIYLYESSQKFDQENILKLSPIITAIEAAEKGKAIINLELTELHRHSAIVNKYQETNKTIDAKRGLVARLRQSIRSVSEGLMGLNEILGKLNAYLKDYLALSGLKNVYGINVDNKFIPYFRDISYYNTSSGGVRTITSIGSFLVRFKLLIEEFGYLPTFLMIDTPGQNIGRYVREDEDRESSDPQLYENIYKQLLTVLRLADSKNQKSQIIVVDNDFPNILEQNPNTYHLVKRFSKFGGNFDTGLINDATDI